MADIVAIDFRLPPRTYDTTAAMTLHMYALFRNETSISYLVTDNGTVVVNSTEEGIIEEAQFSF